jgi:Ca2+/H+ antiporter, TMEM165/GDT1 family
MSLFTGFTAGLLLITLSELGDKTFFIGAILAMRHPRRWVFLGVTTALVAMTALSVWIGQIAMVFPQHYVQGISVALFIGFGLKLLYDAAQLPSQQGIAHEQADALEAIEHREQGITAWSVRAVLSEAFMLTFVAEWGDRTQFATITLTTTQNPYGVFLGAVVGHAICAAIAVICGRLIAGQISERLLTAIGGVLFIVFGIVAAHQMV